MGTTRHRCQQRPRRSAGSSWEAAQVPGGLAGSPDCPLPTPHFVLTVASLMLTSKFDVSDALVTSCPRLGEFGRQKAPYQLRQVQGPGHHPESSLAQPRSISTLAPCFRRSPRPCPISLLPGPQSLKHITSSPNSPSNNISRRPTECLCLSSNNRARCRIL